MRVERGEERFVGEGNINSGGAGIGDIIINVTEGGSCINIIGEWVLKNRVWGYNRIC
jgi:hypothetical protein